MSKRIDTKGLDNQIEEYLEFPISKILDILCKYARKIGENPDDVINEFIVIMSMMTARASFNEYKFGTKMTAKRRKNETGRDV